MRPARIQHALRKPLPRVMQLRQRRANLPALRRRNMHHGFARQTCNQQRGLAVQFSNELPVAIGHWRWARKAARRQVRHELRVIRQLCRAHVLEQRQHIFTPRSGDKIICILYAGQNALHVLQLAQRIVFQPLGQLRMRDCCVDRHGWYKVSAQSRVRRINFQSTT